MLPRVVVHTAVSVDGRIDWFTPDIGTFYQLAGRFQEDATLAGSATILAAVGDTVDVEAVAGAATARGPEAERGGQGAGGASAAPLLVVPDSAGRVKAWRHLLAEAYWRAGVSLSAQVTDRDHLAYLQRAGIDILVAGEDRVDLPRALEELNERYGVLTVRVDSGGTLTGALLRAGLVSEVSVLISPALVGGLSPRSFYRAEDLVSPDGVIPLTLAHVETLPGDQVWLRYEVAPQS